ncbi:MAG: hydroxyisourate hydrolase [Rubrobacter sp.]|nr:hydroxyisourate hydrolase [Rubrobacter sp.]MBA3950716.1 hydroxyisourate hydrolase [Rubrobacter sp.]MDQ3361286.1 hydroxyisourate hydrolase [Actinomycetota bacterium]MDQ3375594.1 hydroxyisourate hydrolase [Actinomycetota bacterium]
MSGLLTTHVLDTANGKPAAGMSIELYAIEREQRRLVKTLRTNADGRTNGPLLGEGEFDAGLYEIDFDVAGYFAGETGLPDPPFLGRVPVRFGVADPEAHYHVPLLVSPWSYSTYRGS